MDLRVEQLHEALAVERDDPREHLVSDGRERVAICRRTDSPAGHLLRGHVRRGSSGHAGHRLQRRPLHQLGEAEIGQDRRVVRRQEDIGGLHVAMDDAAAVGVVKPGGDPAQVFERGSAVEHTLGHPAGEAATRDVLDDHVRGALELAEVVNVDDVRVAQLRNGLGLMPEPGDSVRVGSDRLHDLHRAGPLQLRVVRAVNQAHGPLTDEVLDLVLP